MIWAGGFRRLWNCDGCSPQNNGDLYEKILKWTSNIAGVLVGLVILAVIGLNTDGSQQLTKTHDIQAEAILIPTDDTALGHGEQMLNVAFCITCHSQDLSGEILEDLDPSIGTIHQSNITSLGVAHSVSDLVRAIRHGVD